MFKVDDFVWAKVPPFRFSPGRIVENNSPVKASSKKSLTEHLVFFFGYSEWVEEINIRPYAELNGVFRPERPDDSLQRALIEKELCMANKNSFSGFIREIKTEQDDKAWTPPPYDITLKTQTQELKAHKNILRMHSIFLGDMIDDDSYAIIRINNEFSDNALQSMVSFIYTGQASDDENATENYKIAHKYKVTKMKNAYEEILAKQLNSINAYDMFALAHQTSARKLKKKAISIIANLFPDPIPERILEDPEKVKKLIENKREYEMLLTD